MKRFPHLNDSQFPGIGNIDVYKFDNNFDYSQLDETMMTITVCNVPWDMGEVHVGNAAITGVGNVVYFDGEKARDEWFDAIPTEQKFVFPTKYRNFHYDGRIKIPLPFDVAAKFNYVRVQFTELPIGCESPDGLNEWFYFIRSIERESNNSSVAVIMRDTWQTYIYSTEISGMMLEQGHAPVAKMSADRFLENPIENCEYLTAADIDFGNATQVASSSATVLNDGDMFACIAATGNPHGEWGNANAPTASASSYYMNDGCPSVFVFATRAENLNTLLANIDSQIPQFKGGIEAVFFASSKLISLGTGYTFCGVPVFDVAESDTKVLGLSALDKAMFGYPEQYADLAKLYTMPYAHLELTDENGEATVIRVEDTDGNLTVSATLQMAFPFINIDTRLNGVGGGNRGTLTFGNVTKRSFAFSGRWYDTLKTWDVPLFAVYQDNGTANKWEQFYNYEQTKTAANNDYASASASASAAQGNANALASTSVANTAITVTANTTITQRSISASIEDTNASNSLNTALQAWDAGYTRDTTNNDVNAEYASAAVGAAGGIINGAVSGAMSMGPLGAITGAVGAAIGGATTAGKTVVAANMKSSQAQIAVGYSENTTNATNQNNTDRNDVQNRANTDNTNTSNTATTGITANNAATTNANAGRTYSAAITAAGNALATANASIDNAKYQAGTMPASRFGTFANGRTAATRPMAYICNVVTEDKGAIRQAGDVFLKRGYTYNGYWEFETFNVMPVFSYWKCSEVITSNLSAPDEYMDEIRFFLMGGVTVWRRPEDIGNVSIYENR